MRFQIIRTLRENNPLDMSEEMRLYFDGEIDEVKEYCDDRSNDDEKYRYSYKTI